MGVIVTAESELGKELRKWEQHNTRLSLDANGQSRPGNPYEFRPYPKMVYKAVKRADGKAVCMVSMPEPVLFIHQNDYLRAHAEAEAINAQCHKIVDSESAWLVAKGQGWCETPAAALEQLEREQQALGNAAAEANFGAARMSDVARRELDEANAATHEHVADVTPRLKKENRDRLRQEAGA